MILEVHNVSRTFGGLRALRQVSLAVSEGEVLGLIGPNGSGKTTLLNVIAGVHRPTDGAVYFSEENVTGLSPEALCRRGVSRTFQIAQAFPRMTALENVWVAAVFGNACEGRNPNLGIQLRSHPPKLSSHPADTAGQLLDFVEFPLPHDTLAANLNTAQLKRLDLARALASQPKLLLLDEIFAGLTPPQLRDLAHLLRAIRERGVTMIVVEHLMRVINEECDRVVVLCSGEKIAEGSPDEMASDPRVIDAYLGQSIS